MHAPRLVLVLVLALAAVGAWWLATGSGDAPTEPTPDAKETARRSDATAEAALRGSGRGVHVGEDRSGPIDRLVAQATDKDTNRRHQAFRALKALYERGDVPLERLLGWAVGTEAKGNSDLRAWALAELAKQKPASLALLPELLGQAMGAPTARQQAVAGVLRALGEVRAADVALVRKLFEHEQTEYVLERVLVDALGDLGPDALPLAPTLMDWVREQLLDRQEAAREAQEAGIHVSWDHVEFDVQRLLSKMGDDVVPLLVERLRDAFAKRQKSGADITMWEPEGVYADALAEAGPPGVAALIALLDAASDDDRTTIVNALSWVDGPNEPVRQALLDLMDHADPWTRREAAEGLAKHGKASIPVLLQALRDPDAGVRKNAAGSLKALKVGPGDALDGLRALLAGNDKWAALTAAETIAGFGKDGTVALPKMIERLASSEGWAQSQYAAHVARLGVHDPQALARAFESGSTAARRGLVMAARSMPKPLPGDIRRMLESALRAEDEIARILAAEYLMRSGHPEALAPLLRGFDAEDGFVRTVATEGLAHAGEAAAHLLPRMLERLGREDLYRSNRHALDSHNEEGALDAAIEALGRFDFARMFERIDHPEFDVYYAARQAFERAGPEGLAWLRPRFEGASEARKIAILDICRTAWFRKGEEGKAWQAAARPIARLGLTDPAAAVRIKTVHLLDRDPSMVAEVLPVLLGLLDGSKEHARTAAYRIRALGARAAPIEAELEALTKHPDETIRKYVLQALDAIQDARASGKDG